MFTGKAKELFECWYYKIANFGDHPIILDGFYEMRPEYQWGVIQDFGDSLGYYPVVNKTRNGLQVCYRAIIIKLDESEKLITSFNTRQEARTAAIKKLNELINEKNISEDI